MKIYCILVMALLIILGCEKIPTEVNDNLTNQTQKLNTLNKSTEDNYASAYLYIIRQDGPQAGYQAAAAEFPNMILQDPTDNHWYIDTDGCTDSITVMAAHAALRNYCGMEVSEIVNVLHHSAAIHTLPENFIPVPLYGGFESDNVPVLPYIDGDYENSWQNGYPDSWCVNISAPYNFPSYWDNFYPTSRISQSNNSYSGAYAVDIYLNRNANRTLASGWYMIPPQNRIVGQHHAGIYISGNLQSVIMNLEVIYLDENEQEIETDKVEISSGVGGVYQLNIASSSVLAIEPAYVRFAVVQSAGQNRNHVFLDNLMLGNVLGDIPLPVVLSQFNGTYNSLNHLFISTWRTESEVNNNRFGLFYDDGNIVSATLPNVYVAGQGSTPYPTDYAKDWPMNTDFQNDYLNLTPGQSLDVILGSQDFSNQWHHYTDKSIAIYNTDKLDLEEFESSANYEEEVVDVFFVTTAENDEVSYFRVYFKADGEENYQLVSNDRIEAYGTPSEYASSLRMSSVFLERYRNYDGITFYLAAVDTKQFERVFTELGSR